MHQLKLDPGSGFKTCAGIAAYVMGKYHPHGDAAIYDAMVRLAQDFAARYPLVEGQGNFGSIDGDNAAAMRYTEARQTEVAEAMVADIGPPRGMFGMARLPIAIIGDRRAQASGVHRHCLSHGKCPGFRGDRRNAPMIGLNKHTLTTKPRILFYPLPNQHRLPRRPHSAITPPCPTT